MKRKGLTLMELLTVISILATLAALMFPVYLKVRSRVYETSCANQLRQIGIAIHMYANDHGDGTPYSMPWGLGRLYPHYINSKDVIVCPSFQVLAPEVVEDMHQISLRRWGKVWTSYWQVSPRGLDDIASKNPGEVLSFTEIYVKRGDQTPIAWCDTHRNGCPTSNYGFYISPKSAMVNCGWGTEIEFKGGSIVVKLGSPPNPDAPLIVLRWSGSVSFSQVWDTRALMLRY